MNWPSHGSNPQYLYKAMERTLPEDYTDFSANINPFGPPPALKEKWEAFYEEIFVYPDPFALKLKKRIALHEQISDQSILIGNGGAELITLAARMLAGKRILLVQPTFSEYEQVCRANQCKIVYHQLKEPEFNLHLDELSPRLADSDAIFLCNPNNPTGIQYPGATIFSLIKECAKQNCLVILDEAFFDFLTDYESFVPYINMFSNLIIIRSMTKMFAIPGIRLGYLAAQPDVIDKLCILQSHWSVNTIALLAGELCLQNESFVKMTQNFVEKERERLFGFFEQFDFEFTASKVNFYLLRDRNVENQFPLFDYLIKKAIIPRHTFNFPGLEGRWLRFAIKGREENNLLMEALAEWRHQP